MAAGNMLLALLIATTSLFSAGDGITTSQELCYDEDCYRAAAAVCEPVTDKHPPTDPYLGTMLTKDSRIVEEIRGRKGNYCVVAYRLERFEFKGRVPDEIYRIFERLSEAEGSCYYPEGELVKAVNGSLNVTRSCSGPYFAYRSILYPD